MYMEDNIKTDLRKLDCDDLNVTQVDQDRVQWRAL